jgi:hypothetical protein
MARKNRRRRGRNTADARASTATSSQSIDRATATRAATKRGSSGRGKQSSSRAGYPGARVARVAVDDATWDAFRVLCGSTPASVRLGELVAADVAAARGAQREGSALAAVQEIQRRASELERLLRQT